MDTHSINTTITELTSLYSNLNKRWQNDTCASDLYQSYRQSEYYEVYKKLKEFNIENLILGMIVNSLDEKILVRLCTLLYDNIQIYETRQADFSIIDFSKVYSLQEERLFSNKAALLAKDKEDIQSYPYPTEQERNMLLKENQKERNLLENERSEYIHSNIWMLKNFYALIYEVSKSFISIIESYFPIETMFDGTKCSQKEDNPIVDTDELIFETPQEIDPDTIFRTGMFDRFLSLEQQLIKDQYLDESLNWVAKHDKTHKVDIKSLITFLVGLLDNKYFMSGRDSKIRTFFEARYNIKIGQNFEEQRRLKYLDKYQVAFFEYKF